MSTLQDEWDSAEPIQSDLSSEWDEAEPIATAKPSMVQPQSAVPESMYGKLMAGIGGGFTHIGEGAMQRGMELAGWANMIPPEKVKEYQDYITQTKAIDKPLMDTTPGMVGDIIGQTAVLAPMPGGVTGGLFKRLATSMMAGGATGAIQPTAEDESAVLNAFAGGAAGGAGSGAISVIGKTINTIAPKAKNTIEQLGERFGIRTTLGEATDNPIIKKSETWLEGIPYLGIKSFRIKQQAEAEQAAKTFFAKYTVDPSLDTTAAMKEANDVMLDKMYEAVKKGGSKLPSVEPQAVKQTTNDILSQYPDIFNSIQDNHVKRILTNIASDTQDQTINTGLVTAQGAPITRTQPMSTDFNELWTLRKGLGKEINDARTDTARGVFKQLYSAVSNDMDTMFAGTQVGKEFRAANEAFVKHSVKFDVLRQAYDKSMGTTKAGEMFSPKKFSTELKNLANDPTYKKNVKWTPTEIEEMTGLANIMQVVKRAGQFAENPPTGNRWGLPMIGAGFGGYAMSGTPSGMAAAGGMVGLTGLSKILTTTVIGKRLAMSASKLEPDSPAMQTIVNTLYNQASKLPGIVAID